MASDDHARRHSRTRRVRGQGKKELDKRSDIPCQCRFLSHLEKNEQETPGKTGADIP